jgi:outer membrane protein TolC
MPRPTWLFALLVALPAIGGGCKSAARHDPLAYADPSLTSVTLLQVEHPDMDAPCSDDLLTLEGPRTLKDMSAVKYWDLPLQEAVRLALLNSKVLRDLGGSVIRTPDATPTSLDPAVIETDPRFGVEGALSAFDAQLESVLTGEKIDRRLNNRFVGNLGFLDGHDDNWDTQISKRAATGTRFALRQHIDHEEDNNPGNQFPDGAWNVWYEAEARHPLMQGGGLAFNRIAGPDATPGVYNGVLIARIRTDVSLAEFEVALRDFVSNVENAYWDLYYAYRDLDAKIRARDAALETWRRIHALYEAGRDGGEAEKEAQAREQYFRFEAEAQDSLAGRPLDGTRTNNGSLPGTFRGLPGVLVNEKRLRLIINIPPDPEQLIRPSDEPASAAIVFDWPSITAEALARRSELRGQRWQVQRRELEQLATRNFLQPRLDVVGRYRVRGFGDSLLDPNSDNLPRFDNAYQDLTSGDFAEWQAGLELSMPLGFRQAHVNYRNAELRLARERALLHAQEQEVVYGLAQAVAEMDRAFLVMQTNYNRLVASRDQVAAVEAAFDDDRVEFIALLDAQRRLSEAESQHYRSRTEYAIAVKNVHFEKGTLLDYDGVACTEGPWPGKAYYDAEIRDRQRGRPWAIPPSAIIISTDIQPPIVHLPPIDELPVPVEEFELPANPAPVPPNPDPLPQPQPPV